MAENNTPTASDVKALAASIRTQAEKMEKGSTLQARIFIAVGLFLVLYMGWALNRIAKFIEPTALADTTATIAVGRMTEAVMDGAETGKNMAPELVRDAENAVIRSVPDFRVHLESTLKKQVNEVVKLALENGDKILVEEMKKVPNASALVISAQTNPDDAAKLYAQLRKQVLARTDVKQDIADAMVELNKLRDHMKKLKGNAGLTATERAERRLLQVVLAKLDLPKQGVIQAMAPAPPDKKK